MKICSAYEPMSVMIKGSSVVSGRWQDLLKRTIITACLTLCILLSCTTDLSFADAALPEYARLADLVFPGRPIRASVDATGNVYVIEASKPHVTKYSPLGELLYSITLSSVPTAIKAADDGLLYIGLKDKIEIYDGASLRKTVNGISQPVSIDVASSGAIYAVDLKHYCIKIISPSGDIATVGDHDTLGSDLRDLVLDEANQEFYVLDRNESLSSLYVWRVQAFDLNGNFLRKFSQYGHGIDGKLLSASSLAIDSQRRVHVADNVQNIIGVFDHTGNYLGTLYDKANPFYNPVDMVYRNNRIFILSFLGHKGSVLGFAGYADLAVLPGSLELNVQGSCISGDRTVTLSSTGSGDLNWRAVTDAGWLGLSTVSGSIGGGLADQVDVAVNAAGLAPGRHTGKITFAFNGGSSYLGVNVNVLTPPVLNVSPPGLEVQTEAGTVVTRQATIELGNDLAGSLAWRASADCGWLSISPASGLSNALTPATVTINTSGLTPGIHNGKIVLAAEGMEGLTTEIPVILTITAGNMIQVTTNNENAYFSISGPQNFNGSGSSWSAGNVADGSYTITYGELQGLKTPLQETQTAAGGNTITFTGNYGEIKPENIIITQDGIRDITTVKIYDINSKINEFVAFGKKRGGLVTAVGDIDGDGTNEIAATVRHGISVAGIFDRSGRKLAEFSVFAGKGTYDISTSDLDNEGSAELIVSKSSGMPVIKVLGFSNGTVNDTGISFMPFADEKDSNPFVGAGDIDGDGIPEIVAVNSSGRPVLMRIWAPDTSAAPGNWSVTLKNEVILDIKPHERLTGMEVKPVAANETAYVLIMLNEGRLLAVGPDGSGREAGAAGKGVNVIDAGDVNGDGNVEIMAGLKNGTVKIFTLDGALIRSIRAFNNGSGVRVSTGDLGY